MLVIDIEINGKFIMTQIIANLRTVIKPFVHSYIYIPKFTFEISSNNEWHSHPLLKSRAFEIEMINSCREKCWKIFPIKNVLWEYLKRILNHLCPFHIHKYNSAKSHSKINEPFHPFSASDDKLQNIKLSFSFICVRFAKLEKSSFFSRFVMK